MSRILYDHLTTESGFDLLTESGDDLVTRMVGIAGDCTASADATESGTVYGRGRLTLVGRCAAHGQAGSATGTGHLTMVGGTMVVQGGTPIDRTPTKTLHGICTAGPKNHGYAAGKGTVSMVGKATAGPKNHGYASGKGHATLAGKATAGPLNHGYAAGTGHDEDEMGLIIALLLA